jgi:hypothetical protein
LVDSIVLSFVVALADEVVVQSTIVEVHLLGVVWPVSSALVSGFYPATVLEVAVSSTYPLVTFFVAGGNCLLLRE